MRNKRHFVSGGIVLNVAAFVVLIGSLLLASYGNTHPLPLSGTTISLAGGLGFLIFICIGNQLIFFDTSWVTRRFRDMQPMEADPNTVVRVVKTDTVKGEYFVYASLGDTVKQAVEHDWPFKGRLRRKAWHVVDEQGNDVTDQPYIDEEGTLIVVFD